MTIWAIIRRGSKKPLLRAFGIYQQEWSTGDKFLIYRTFFRRKDAVRYIQLCGRDWPSKYLKIVKVEV